MIYGVGPHHNVDSPTDADKLAEGLVTTLKENGHSVGTATISTSNGIEYL